MKTKIKGLLITPGKIGCEEIEIDNTVKGFQSHVGGMIELVRLDNTTSAYIHDDGLRLKLELNVVALVLLKEVFGDRWKSIVVGNMLIAGTHHSGSNMDLPKKMASRIKAILADDDGNTFYSRYTPEQIEKWINEGVAYLQSFPHCSNEE